MLIVIVVGALPAYAFVHPMTFANCQRAPSPQPCVANQFPAYRRWSVRRASLTRFRSRQTLTCNGRPKRNRQFRETAVRSAPVGETRTSTVSQTLTVTQSTSQRSNEKEKCRRRLITSTNSSSSLRSRHVVTEIQTRRKSWANGS